MNAFYSRNIFLGSIISVDFTHQYISDWLTNNFGCCPNEQHPIDLIFEHWSVQNLNSITYEVLFLARIASASLRKVATPSSTEICLYITGWTNSGV